MNPTPTLVFNTGFAQTTGNLSGGSFTVATGVAVGDTVFVFIGERHPSGTPAITGVSDSKGNTYTIVSKNASGAVVPSAFAMCTLTTALIPGDTISFTMSGSTTNEYAGSCVSLPGACTVDGSAPAWKANTSSTAHSFTLNVPTATDLVLGVDIESGGISNAGAATVSGATKLAEYDGTNREIVTFYANPAATGNLTVTVTWDTAHVDSMIMVPIIVPAQNQAPVQGQWGISL